MNNQTNCPQGLAGPQSLPSGRAFARSGEGRATHADFAWRAPYDFNQCFF